MSQDPRNPSRSVQGTTVGNPGTQQNPHLPADQALGSDLDATIAETFPASDPAAPAIGGHEFDIVQATSAPVLRQPSPSMVEVEPGVRVYVQDLDPGDARATLLLIHGWPASHRMFERQADRPARARHPLCGAGPARLWRQRQAVAGSDL